MDTPVLRRNPWVAALLSVLCNGLGHAYAGRARAGVIIYALWLALEAVFVAALRAGFGLGMAAGALLLGFWVGQAVLAAHAARADAPGPRRWTARPLGLAALYIASVLATAALRLPFDHVMPRPFYIAGASMIPALRIGDTMMAVPEQAVARGDVVVHRPPPDSPRADPLVKRVVGLAGDTVEVREGRLLLNGKPVERAPAGGPCAYWTRAPDGAWSQQACVAFEERLDGRAYQTFCSPSTPCGDMEAIVIPPGHVFLLGDNRDHSADSRYYGPIPERDVLGRASYVYFSWGPTGIQWERMGATVH